MADVLIPRKNAEESELLSISLSSGNFLAGEIVFEVFESFAGVVVGEDDDLILDDTVSSNFESLRNYTKK